MTYKEKCTAASLTLGKAIAKAEVCCPVCEDQPLSCDGDDAAYLFCPHCELAMAVNVKLSWRHKDATTEKVLDRAQQNQAIWNEVMWLLVRLMCYMPRPEDIPDDKRGFAEYSPEMLTAVAARANDMVAKIRSGRL